jgi:CRP/FNR family transcriptional regulator, cyclic AMP receptor protein
MRSPSLIQIDGVIIPQVAARSAGLPGRWAEGTIESLDVRQGGPRGGDRQKGQAMELHDLLETVEMFEGLTEAEIDQLAALCHEEVYGNDQLIFSQGQIGDTMYVVREGFVEIIIGHGSDAPDTPKSIIHLGSGQVFGEMALVDRGRRSATARSVSGHTVLDGFRREAFMSLCEADHQIGYTVMRNLAADLSFKLRHSNLRRH